MKRWFLAACGLAAVGCVEFGEEDARIPGETLGTYQVVAALQSSTCGPGALGSTDVWEFEVKLSREGNELYWLNGQQPITGKVASDGVTFSFGTQVVVEASEQSPTAMGCSVVRTDTASGQLSSGSLDVSSFDGLLRYGFVPAEGADCTGLVGVEGGFHALPCEMSYTMSGTRTARE